MKTIGVLLPQSKAYPKIAKDFTKGLKMALDNSGEFEIKFEGVGLGSDPKATIDGIQKLVNQENVDLITGLFGHNGISEICDFVEEIEETLIFSDLGATTPIDLSVRKGIYCNSLGLVQSTGLLGRYFLKNDLKKIGMSTCYYEAGYGFVNAMEKVIYNNGGSFAGHFVTPLHPREDESELMMEFVDSCQPDVIFGSHNGEYAKEHASFLAKNKLHTSQKIYTTQFSFDENVLNDYPTEFNGVRTISTWHVELDTPENKKFVEEYESTNGSTPSVFALLGYENGLLIQNLLSNKGTIDNQPIKGPRVNFSMNEQTRRTESAHHIWELQAKPEKYEWKKIELFLEDGITESLYSDVENENSSGWFNAYLCY